MTERPARTPAVRRLRPPLHWKYGVSVRKRWLRLRRLWRADDGAIETCRYFGARFQVEPNEVIGREIILKRYEWIQIPLMIDACRALKPAVFLDIGANFGLYACIIGRQKLARRVMAFEPNRAAFARLRAHLALNGLADVDARETALGARQEAATLVPAPGDNSGLSVIAPGHADGYRIEVVALDDLIALAGEPIVLKIDVEGYELPVLQGAARLLARNYGYAQIEALDERAAEVIDSMAGLGWRLTDRVNDDLLFRRDSIADGE
jgi:FkbM family methyltransferase